MRFLKRTVEGIEATGKRQVFFDDDQTGLALRVSEVGRKTFYFTYRAGKGRGAEKKWVMLGTFPTLTVDQAREQAKQKAAQVSMGNDPANEARNEKAAPLLKEVLEVFFEAHGAKLKPSTMRSYRQLAEQHVIPAMGKYKAKDVLHRHTSNLHHVMRETPYQANRCAALLSKFFNWCEKNGYRDRGTNPVQGLEKYEEHKRKVFMGKEELEALGNAFRVMEGNGYTDSETGKVTVLDPVIAAALKMLLFTGARCGEVLSLKWEYVDFKKGLAHLPDSKTGAKTLHLPPPALAVLEALPHVSEYCFPGKGKTGHVVNIKDTWARLLETAGLTGWRIHDLRHAYASYAVCSGKSLPVIGAILGHTQTATTARYAHLADNPVALAAAETAAQLLTDFTGGKVLPFKKAVG